MWQLHCGTLRHRMWVLERPGIWEASRWRHAKVTPEIFHALNSFKDGMQRIQFSEAQTKGCLSPGCHHSACKVLYYSNLIYLRCDNLAEIWKLPEAIQGALQVTKLFPHMHSNHCSILPSSSSWHSLGLHRNEAVCYNEVHWASFKKSLGRLNWLAVIIAKGTRRHPSPFCPAFSARSLASVLPQFVSHQKRHYLSCCSMLQNHVTYLTYAI